jgi:hypothetical protein
MLEDWNICCKGIISSDPYHFQRKNFNNPRYPIPSRPIILTLCFVKPLENDYLRCNKFIEFYPVLFEFLYQAIFPNHILIHRQ